MSAMLSWRLVRVAAIAALVAAGLYVVAVTTVDMLIVHSEYASIDQRLDQRLAIYEHDPLAVHAPIPAGNPNDPFDAPIFVWEISPAGELEGQTGIAPQLPPALYRTTEPRNTRLGGQHFRLEGATVFTGDHVVVGQTLAPVDELLGALVFVEIIPGVPIVVLVFLGAWIVAYRSVRPVEQARRRQLAFTADASHELRTPLTVIEAEASLALTREREAAAYQESLRRITTEAGRLRRIVEDLLFLARFDAQPPEHGPLGVDAARVAEEAAGRFQALAESRRQTLRVEITQRPLPLPVPPEWLERVLGVLLDNACRYTPEGGSIQLSAGAQGDRVRLQVDDSGTGIPPSDRDRIFDRFRRANPEPGGAGLGLAIADAVVRATGGRWEVGESPLGGARFAIHWPLQGNAAPLPAKLPAQA